MCRIRLIVCVESEECAASIMQDVQEIVLHGKTPSSVRQYGHEVRAVFNDLPDDFANDPEHVVSLLEQDVWAEKPGMKRIVAQPVDI